MTDASEPTGSDQIRDTVKSQQTQVVAISGVRLVQMARERREAHGRRRRNVVRGLTGAGAAAVIIVAVVVVALGTGESSTRVAGRGSPTANSQTALGQAFKVHVKPSTDLRDGQRVEVTAYDFDAGTRVTFLECAVTPDQNDPTMLPPSSGQDQSSADGPWICEGGIGDAPHSTAEEVAGSEDRTQATTSYQVSGTISGKTMHLYASGVGASIAGDHPVPTRCAPAGATRTSDRTTSQTAATGTTSLQDAVTTMTPTTSASASKSESSTNSTSTIAPCTIVAMGKVDGKPTILSSRPLSFAEEGTPESTPPAPPASDVPPSTAPSANQDCNFGTSPTGGCVVTTVPSTVPAALNCPTSPPDVQRQDGTDSTTPLLVFAPTQITICHYPVELASPEAPPKQPVTIDDQVTILRITKALRLLATGPTKDQQCTLEMGESLVLIATGATNQAMITVQFYGCGMVGNGTSVRQGGKSLAWIADLSTAN